jgi:hypothetical protein
MMRMVEFIQGKTMIFPGNLTRVGKRAGRRADARPGLREKGEKCETLKHNL